MTAAPRAPTPAARLIVTASMSAVSLAWTRTSSAEEITDLPVMDASMWLAIELNDSEAFPAKPPTPAPADSVSILAPDSALTDILPKVEVTVASLIVAATLFPMSFVATAALPATPPMARLAAMDTILAVPETSASASLIAPVR